MPRHLSARRVAAAAVALLLAGAHIATAADATSVAGVVRDPAGAPVAGASVTLSTPLGAIAATARSDAAGAFRFEAVAAGSYVLSTELPGFATRRLAVQVGEQPVTDLAVGLQPEAFREEVTVTAAPGRADSLGDVAQRVNVIGEEKIALRAKAVLAQAASEEVGLHLQRTSPTMGGIFVRGLTGTKVNVYVDGVRYTTSAAARRGQHVLQHGRAGDARGDRGGARALERGVRQRRARRDRAAADPRRRLQLQRRARLRKLERERRQRRRELRLVARHALRGSDVRTSRHRGRAPGQHAACGGRRRLAQCRHALPRAAREHGDRRAPAGHRLHPVRRPAQGQLGDHAQRAARRGVPARRSRTAASATTSCSEATAT